MCKWGAATIDQKITQSIVRKKTSRLPNYSKKGNNKKSRLAAARNSKVPKNSSITTRLTMIRKFWEVARSAKSSPHTITLIPV